MRYLRNGKTRHLKLGERLSTWDDRGLFAHHKAELIAEPLKPGIFLVGLNSFEREPYVIHTASSGSYEVTRRWRLDVSLGRHRLIVARNVKTPRRGTRVAA